ncbi:MAG: hypothetical protein R3D59_01390 [Paracoccaceae bacterium]
MQASASRRLSALRKELRLDRHLGNLNSAVHGAREGAERVRDIVEDLRRLSAEGSGETISSTSPRPRGSRPTGSSGG